MALIPIGDWIDRFGMLDEIEEATAGPPDDSDAPCARHRTAHGRVFSARDAVGAFLKRAWARRNLPRLTLRRG